MINPDPGPQDGCTCPHADAALGVLYGIFLGKGTVRLLTTPGCPVHAACARYTTENRAAYDNGRWLYCPVHGTTHCPARKPA